MNWHRARVNCLFSAGLLVLAGCGDDQEAASGGEAAGQPNSPVLDTREGGEAARQTNGPVLELRELNDWYRAVLVNADTVDDPRELEAIARPFCDGLEVCRVGLWYDVADMPTEMPVREVQLRYQVFSFGRTATGAESALWNCSVFPEFEAQQLCLPRPIN